MQNISKAIEILLPIIKGYQPKKVANRIIFHTTSGKKKIYHSTQQDAYCENCIDEVVEDWKAKIKEEPLLAAPDFKELAIVESDLERGERWNYCSSCMELIDTNVEYSTRELEALLQDLQDFEKYDGGIYKVEFSDLQNDAILCYQIHDALSSDICKEYQPKALNKLAKRIIEIQWKSTMQAI